MKKSKLRVINELRVEDPCPIPRFSEEAEVVPQGWYCRHCERQVYNLSKLSYREIGDVIERTNGDFCAAIARREDGSIVVAETEPSPFRRSAGAIIAAAALLAVPAAADDQVMELGKIKVAADPVPNGAGNGASGPHKDGAGSREETAQQHAAPAQSPVATPSAAPSPASGLTHTRGKVAVTPSGGKSNKK